MNKLQIWVVGKEEFLNFSSSLSDPSLSFFLFLFLFVLKISAIVLGYGEGRHPEKSNFSSVKAHMFAVILHIPNGLYQK